MKKFAYRLNLMFIFEFSYAFAVIDDLILVPNVNFFMSISIWSISIILGLYSVIFLTAVSLLFGFVTNPT